MTIPLHTFEPTGEPCIDSDMYLRLGGEAKVDFAHWFGLHHSVLSYTAEHIAREAVVYDGVERGPFEKGVYFLLHGDRIAYVGRSQCIANRLLVHYMNNRPFNRYWCFGGIPLDWLGHVEGYYIKRLKPFLNSKLEIYSPVLDKVAKEYKALWDFEAKELAEQSE
ncbi:hypothetical protein [Pararobbsia alpina]|uniref:Uncharacterized protein n=1 Tax=Pararobbsia alpina TaxID=621374 RepID=A0A6S7BCF9_9BURK|nr:hypothetical protein [Pararobbsia alpina]CAB3784135.1 hypothetical protein LMG28138_01746 [Pararobbsia alpina]